MKVREFIEVLKEFPEDSELCFADSDGVINENFIYGVEHSFESNPEKPEYDYNITSLIVRDLGNDRFEELIDEKVDITGDHVWVNTLDYVSTYDDVNNIHFLRIDRETHRFTEFAKE